MIYLIVVLAGKQSVNIALSLFLLCLLALVGRYLVAVALFKRNLYNLESAQKASKKLFKSFFWNMLEQGVYFAPSPYETGFISTAHTEEDIDRTVEAVRISLSRLG